MPRFTIHKWLKPKDNLERGKPGESCPVPGVSHKMKTGFLTQRHADRSTVSSHIQDAHWGGGAANQELCIL